MTTLYDYIETTGVILPDTSTLLTDVQSEFQNALGADINLDSSTPQGMLIAAEVSARDAVVRNNAALANQINPNLAQGVFLDAIWSLMGGQRSTGTPSTVSATITGQSGVSVLSGSIAQTTAGDQFELISTVTIGSSGSVVGQFQSVQNGAIPCAENSLTQIITQTLGWETVNNGSNVAVVGTGTETDAQARAARVASLGQYSKGGVASITAALTSVSGVLSYVLRENYTSTTATIDSISIPANSFYACVNGGTDLDVATALLKNKSVGCGWTGNTTVAVTDATSGQVYNVKFDRPSQVSISIDMTISNASAITDPIDAVTTAIIDYTLGLVNGFSAWEMGIKVSPFEISAAVAAQISGIIITDCQICVTGGTYAPTTLQMAINQLPVTNADNMHITTL